MEAPEQTHSPSVTIVFLVYNRREELRTSLEVMLSSDVYPAEQLDVIVVDNASSDGSGDMVRTEFPQVKLIRREVNCGISGWNDGFAVARGDYVVALDDDCYLPGDTLRRAIAAAEGHPADLVSFSVRAGDDPDYVFNDSYRTGLLTFWGCAVVMRRSVVEALTGYDPEIFVWANELEFTLRAYDQGFRHLHAPEIQAVHLKPTLPTGVGKWTDWYGSRGYLVNKRHFAYIAAKLLAPRDALEALIALLVVVARDTVRYRRAAAAGVPEVLRGFAHGTRHRRPLANRLISRTYRRNFHSFASPWWTSRTLGSMLRDTRDAVLRGTPLRNSASRESAYFAERAPYYPSSAASLDFREDAAPTPAGAY